MKFEEWMRGVINNFKKVAKIYADHYVVLSSTVFILFTALCHFYTTGYYSNFGIDFYQFGSLSDVYQAALTGQILIFLYVLLVMAYSIYIIISREDRVPDDNLVRTKIFKILIILLIFWAFVMLPFIYFVSSTKDEVLKVKEGFTARYTIHTENSQIDCVQIVASTGDYIVVWDGQLTEARIISRQSVVRFDLIMEPPPSSYLWHPRGRRPTEAQINDLTELQQRWSEKLKTKCGMTVEWPKLRRS